MGWLLSLFTGPLFNSLFGSLVDAYKAKLAAENTRDAKAVDLAIAEIQAEIEARKAAKEIIIAEQGWWVTAWIRPLFAYPVIVYWWKIIFYDKLLGLGSTDALTGMVGEWAGWIVMAYFAVRPIEKVARVFARR